MEILKNLNSEEKTSAFLYILNTINNEKNVNTQINMIISLLKSKLIYGSGYYSSDIIENILIRESNKLNIELTNKYNKNTILHIMTTSYSNGGHTRVVERWIENPLDLKQHSLLLTEQNVEEVNQRLKMAILDNKGEIVSINNIKNIYEKAIELRKIASKYEIIILHIHNYDILPILAFANKNFTRPIALYNHSDHLFWIGICISDMILELRTYGIKVSNNYRDIARNFFVGIPLDDKICKNYYNKNEIKENLKISKDKKIILSVASSYKFTTYKAFNFTKIINQVLLENENTYFIIIGANANSLNWNINHSRVKIINKIPYEELIKYISIADLCIDSFPLGGGATLIDMINQKVPILSLKTIIPQFDFIINSNAYCKNIKELLYKSACILNNIQYKQYHIDNLTESLLKYNGTDNWNNKINNFYNIIESKEHKTYNFNSKYNKNLLINDFLCNLYKNNNFTILKIIGIVKFFKYLLKGMK